MCWSHYLLLPRVHISWNLELQLGLNPNIPIWDVKVPRGLLTTVSKLIFLLLLLRSVGLLVIFTQHLSISRQDLLIIHLLHLNSESILQFTAGLSCNVEVSPICLFLDIPLFDLKI